ncbi:universal stress protein [Allobranchiibius sp. CTAmp26]|uniref:universal stress protein n=1 Tax=Allobranchiibius sp. CTAmp26 TaxID=2815214 RepID=UPI001AA0E80E|nr:universal stress protein [Allobranchiibius sp. CTAmp26]MBO1756201.1 universal stress protein [Allobranchiibius sp. CTAmp26]
MDDNQYRIVAGVDSSHASTTAVEWAARAAAARQGSLRLLHGFSPDQSSFAFGMDTDADAIRTSGERLLARLAAHVHATQDAVPVTTSQSDDYPAKALVRASLAADLVVLGAHGDSQLGLASVGQTAAQVASHASVPVTIVRGASGEQHPFGRITVGLDPSEDARRALDWAIEEAARSGAELLALHAWQPHDADDPHLRKSDWAAYARQVEERVQEWVEPQRRAHSDVKVQVQVERANPSRALTISSRSSDLVVVGARGSGGFEGLRLGRVSRDLLGHAACSLTIVR